VNQCIIINFSAALIIEVSVNIYYFFRQIDRQGDGYTINLRFVFHHFYEGTMCAVNSASYLQVNDTFTFATYIL